MVGGLEVKFSLGTLLIWHLYSEKKRSLLQFLSLSSTKFWKLWCISLKVWF